MSNPAPETDEVVLEEYAEARGSSAMLPEANRRRSPNEGMANTEFGSPLEAQGIADTITISFREAA